MKKLRYGLIVLSILVCSATAATAQVSIGIGLPNLSIGINLPVYPELVRVPGYPVYYAPRMTANYFFYDGMYWVYQSDNWYASSWYNGPWGMVQPEVVPLFVLRIPVRYYRQPPVYFRGWQPNAPPRWGQHWGHGWEQRRSGWNRWNRSSVPAPAPLPVYQRQYSGDRYPRVEQQHTIRSQQYRYQPRDTIVRQHLKQVEQKAPAPVQRGRQEAPGIKSPRQQEPQRPASPQQRTPAAPHAQPQPQQRQGGDTTHKAVPVKPPVQQRSPAVQQQRQQPGAAQPGKQGNQQMKSPKQQETPHAAPPQQRAPAVHEQKQQPGAAQERGQGQNRDEERGRGRDK